MNKKVSIKRKIKIALDARPLAYGMTGNSRYLIKALEHLGSWDDRYEIHLLSHKNLHPMFSYILDYPGIRAGELTSNVPGPLWLHTRFPSLAKKYKADLIWGSLQLLPRFGKFCPQIVNFHDLNVVSAPLTMAKWNFYQHKLFVRSTLASADSILCLSKNTKNEIITFSPESKDKLVVVYPGVDSISNKLELPEQSKTWGKFLFTLGTLEPRKNLKTVLTAYLKLKENNPKYPYSFVIAGRAGWGEEAQELYTKLKLGAWESKSVYFLENPSETILAGLYKSCSGFIFPSTHEGFGLPLLEAMREKKICIASNIPVFSEILNPKQDLLVPALDSEAWLNALLAFQNKKNLSRTWNSKEWTWKGTAEKIAREIDRCSK